MLDLSRFDFDVGHQFIHLINHSLNRFSLVQIDSDFEHFIYRLIISANEIATLATTLSEANSLHVIY